MEHVAFYAGSFDPITNGHLDVIRQACNISDRLYVAVGINDAKNAMFSFEERELMIRDACSRQDYAHKVETLSFQGLTIHAASHHGASILIRGLRDVADFDQEMRMAAMNAHMAPDIQTVFVAASAEVYFIAGTFIRQIALAGGDVSNYVPSLAAAMLKKRYGERSNA